MLTKGASPCHISLDEQNGILHVANYGGGSYSAFSVDKSTGVILEEIFFEAYGKGSNVVPDRQADAHAHMAFFIKDFIYVVDLGSDKIHHYQVWKHFQSLTGVNVMEVGLDILFLVINCWMKLNLVLRIILIVIS